jgi:hypothetical protein
VLAIVVKILPKIGAISLLAIKIPEATTEDLYVRSVNHTFDSYAELLKRLRDDPDADLALPNRDLDTAGAVKPGNYRLADDTYAQLLDRVTSQPERPIPAELRQSILDFYADPDAPNYTKKNANAWKRVQSELPILKDLKTLEPVTRGQQQ